MTINWCLSQGKAKPTTFRSGSEFSCCHNACGHFTKNKFSPFESLRPLARKSLLLLTGSFPFSGSPSLSRPLPMTAAAAASVLDSETGITTARLWASCFSDVTFLSRVGYKWKFPYSPDQHKLQAFGFIITVKPLTINP